MPPTKFNNEYSVMHVYTHNGPQAFLYPLERLGNEARFPCARSHIRGREEDGAYTNLRHFLTLELQEMMGSITSVTVKGATVTVEMVKTTKPSIRVSNITTLCDEEFLRFYFGRAKRSGGGEVDSIKILSETEAIVTFTNPAGM